MEKETFGRAHLKTNQDLRDFLDYHWFPSYKEFASKDVSVALSCLHAYVDVLCEMTKRLWDELEGHQDACKIQRHVDEEMNQFIQGFGYKSEQPRIEHKPCGYIDNDADDGWGTTSCCRPELQNQIQKESKIGRNSRTKTRGKSKKIPSRIIPKVASAGKRVKKSLKQNKKVGGKNG